MSKSRERSPLNCSVNWFKYRLPKSNAVVAGASPFLVQGLNQEGFVITPYFNEDYGVVMIPCTYRVTDHNILKPLHSELYKSTTKEDYIKEVSKIIKYHKKRKGKTVASRCIKVEAPIDLNATFDELCRQYHDAFIFMFSSEATGTWIGASPELLLSEDTKGIHTMALAGTRPEYIEGDWDEKNIEEQQMVTDYIVDILKCYCKKVKIEPSYTKKAGDVAHICTPISACKPQGTLSDILLRLSPTPALCGSNKEESFKLIAKLEKHEREMYGGFCGPYRIYGKTSFYVIVRTARCSDDAICVYAGGGITKDSIPEDEWEETEMKSKTIINCIKSNDK